MLNYAFLVLFDEWRARIGLALIENDVETAQNMSNAAQVVLGVGRARKFFLMTQHEHLAISHFFYIFYDLIFAECIVNFLFRVCNVSASYHKNSKEVGYSPMLVLSPQKKFACSSNPG
jgi:hypothetical protein